MHISEYIKIEPDIYFIASERGSHNNYNITFGIGSFYCYPLQRGEFYGGIRFGFTGDHWEWSAESLHENVGFYIAPAIGVEYFIAERVSLGFELQPQCHHYADIFRYKNGKQVDTVDAWDFVKLFMIRIYLF